MYRSRKLVRPGPDGPFAAEIDQHCLVESFSTGTGGTFTRRMDYVTVHFDSGNGPGTAWVDYEIPGMIPRQVGPRGQFDSANHAVGLTFPIPSRLLNPRFTYILARSGPTAARIKLRSRSTLPRRVARPPATAGTTTSGATSPTSASPSNACSAATAPTFAGSAA